jgi:hypothetical protein
LLRLARAARDGAPEAPFTSITVLELVKSADAIGVSRVGGPGFDLRERHPMYGGLPMTHVLTLALDDAPSLRGVFGRAPAFALYVSEVRGNRAHTPFTDETAVLCLDAAGLARGIAKPNAEDLPLAGIRTTTLDVPVTAVVDPGPLQADLQRDIRALPARAGGAPLWLQEPEPVEGFAMQFDTRFAGLSLGDGGIMYVFRDTAFWQSR